MQIHLLDGTYELFRAFYAAPSARGRGGAEVGAARVLLRSLSGWFAATGVTHAAVAFDTVIESFRNRLFDGYKTGDGIEPDLLAQFPLAERVTRALGVVTWSMVEFEADDALATFAHRAAADERVERVNIVTPDKDLAQCVRGTRVVGCDRHRKIVLDEEGVKAKFGVPPSAIPDYLALVGDTADGIPGVPRWGAKSAAALLARFGDLTRIPPDPAAWGVSVRGADALAASLREHLDAALLYRELATLRCDVPLAETIDELELRGADRPLLEALAEELGDPAILDRARYRA
ncbi:MAG TPA: 5'-3' exonuclease H3TH domain-containing protein [Polyangiaceae bacterium]|nr:5'-3' exonuclease H3TH domain-containing protein [Polyangiaceae bacterium]